VARLLGRSRQVSAWGMAGQRRASLHGRRSFECLFSLHEGFSVARVAAALHVGDAEDALRSGTRRRLPGVTPSSFRSRVMPVAFAGVGPLSRRAPRSRLHQAP
jgi:hypothetical protein